MVAVSIFIFRCALSQPLSSNIRGGKLVKLFFPDALWHCNLISGAAFLYFLEEKVAITLHPSVSTFMTGIAPFDFAKFVNQQNPSWINRFNSFFEIWSTYRNNLNATYKIIEPLRDKTFKTIRLIYPRGSHAFNASNEIIEASNLKQGDINKIIDPFSASDELFSHIFFEMYLELYHKDKSANGLMKMGMEAAKEKLPFKSYENLKMDWMPLYEYCNKLFGSRTLQGTLAISYMFRLPSLQSMREILLSNERLIGFLNGLPIEYQKDKERKDEDRLTLDVIGWEFFRQIISPLTDPLDNQKVAFIEKIVSNKRAEIENLKHRCLSLAQDFKDETDLYRLQKKVATHIKVNVQKDIREILDIDKYSFENLITSIFSDEKAWIAISAFIISLIAGGPIITAGAALVGLSNIGAKSVKVAAERRKKLRSSDYALIYRMRHL